jgi:hypothetical protein
MKKVLFITSNNLATNPRLVKELKIARNHFQCTVLSFKLCNWSDLIDAEIRASFPDVEFIIQEAGRKPFLTWFFITLLEIILRFIYPFCKENLFVNSVAHSKRSFLIWSKLKKYRGSYDFIIAHNLATLYPAYRFAKWKMIRYAFDIEDFHPGEYISKDALNEKTRRIYLLQRLLPDTSYISYASPLIGEAVLSIIPTLKDNTHFVLNNSFLSCEFKQPNVADTKKLKLVWFSQKIASGRGLELVLPILDEFRKDIQLTLIGDLSPTFNDTFLVKYSRIVDFKEPLPQSLLHQLLANYDIGLALECASADLNRELCLTNKLFAYAQAGLFVVATNTKGQTLFVKQNPWCGILTGQTSTEIRETIKKIVLEKESIKLKANYRFEKSKKLEWEQEHGKLLKVWESLNLIKHN